MTYSWFFQFKTECRMFFRVFFWTEKPSGWLCWCICNGEFGFFCFYILRGTSYLASYFFHSIFAKAYSISRKFSINIHQHLIFSMYIENFLYIPWFFRWLRFIWCLQYYIKKSYLFLSSKSSNYHFSEYHYIILL